MQILKKLNFPHFFIDFFQKIYALHYYFIIIRNIGPWKWLLRLLSLKNTILSPIPLSTSLILLFCIIFSKHMVALGGTKKRILHTHTQTFRHTKTNIKQTTCSVNPIQIILMGLKKLNMFVPSLKLFCFVVVQKKKALKIFLC